MVSTDAGYLNYQMECGHVCWATPKTPDFVRKMTDAQARWDSHCDVHVPCLSCHEGSKPSFPMHIALPLPMPRDHQEELRTSDWTHDYLKRDD